MKKILLFIFLSVFIFSCDESNPVDNNDGEIVDSVTDVDGNLYHAIKIGNQEWTVENLRVTKYNDGSAIPLVTGYSEWKSLSTPGYCYYKNTMNTDSIKKFGALYNWYVVSPINPEKIAPSGWRVPSDSDWTVLEKYLIANGYNWDGTTTYNKIAKSLAAKTDWDTISQSGAPGDDLTKNNRSGFSGLPGGYRSGSGSFADGSLYGSWWSATAPYEFDAWHRSLVYEFSELLRNDNQKRIGFSVRLVRD